MTESLFTPVECGGVRLTENWCVARDGDPRVLALHMRHYSRRPNKELTPGNGSRCSGPGESAAGWRSCGVSGKGLLILERC